MQLGYDCKDIYHALTEKPKFDWFFYVYDYLIHTYTPIFSTPNMYQLVYVFITFADALGPLLLTWFNFNPSMDK